MFKYCFKLKPHIYICHCDKNANISNENNFSLVWIERQHQKLRSMLIVLNRAQPSVTSVDVTSLAYKWCFGENEIGEMNMFSELDKPQLLSKAETPQIQSSGFILLQPCFE